MSQAQVQLEYHGKCAVLTFNRPDKRNSFNKDMWSSLEDAVKRLKAKLPRAIIVTGAGDKAFSAGFDVHPSNPHVESFMDSIRRKDHGLIEELIRYIRDTTGSLVSLPVPVIAAINGLAFGGGAELAVQCDLRVMDPAAVICFSEVRLGLMTDWGGGVALTRLLGRARAADLLLTARRVGAEEALRMGLVDRVSKQGKSVEEALEIAQTISKNGPRAVRASLEVIRRSYEIPLRDALELETLMASDLIVSGECVHGISAFIAKKEPEFPDPE